MEGVDTKDEERSVSKSVCLALQCLDLVVCPFEWPRGDGMIVVRQNASAVCPKGVGEVLEYTDTRCLGPCDPVLQVGFCGSFIGLRPEESEIFLHVVCSRQGFVDAQRLFQPGSFVPIIVEVFGILQKQPSSSLEDLLVEQVGGFPIQLTTQLGQFLVKQLDDVEVIEHDGCAGQICAYCTDAWDISMATAWIFALEFLSRVQKASRASAPLPSPTKTTAPLSRSRTTVK